ncbi:MAG: bidirectional hydrogenase complex protein HoxE [Aphanizomenon flos-aquae WA102]|uniref:Bidirectional hydrogenase complex protein HoxE n=1 Tax=Aphanizomenon flos-aquae WA102 TaxID=1710896 RepID=A0A1B7X3W7_APHFL|nr:MAG: bidirectional hydrogenase complex protein HoxE [Aphanizomenon flos-aquae WA102]
MKTSIPPSSTHLIEDKRLKMLDATIKRHQYQQDALIEILHRACELFGYLELDLLLYIAHSLKLPPSRVYGVATFYHLFSLAPKGVHNCVVCTGTACYVKGAQTILANVEQFTQIHAGETTPNGQISLMTARCLGACGIAPAVVFDGTVLGNQTPDSVCEKVRAWWQNGTK